MVQLVSTQIKTSDKGNPFCLGIVNDKHVLVRVMSSVYDKLEDKSTLGNVPYEIRSKTFTNVNADGEEYEQTSYFLIGDSALSVWEGWGE